MLRNYLTVCFGFGATDNALSMITLSYCQADPPSFQFYLPAMLLYPDSTAIAGWRHRSVNPSAKHFR